MKEFSEYLNLVAEECDEEKANALIANLDKEYPTLVFTEYRSTAEWLISYLLMPEL